MENEEKKVEEKPAVEPAPEPEKKQDDGIDYKSETEKLKKQLSQAEYKLEQQRRNNKKEEVEPEEFIDIDKIKEDLAESQRVELDNFKLEMSKGSIDDVLSDLSKNNDERELIKFHYENTLKKTGFSKDSIKNDLIRAKILANSAKFEKENSELKEALKTQKTMNTKGTTSGQEIDSSDMELSPEEESAVKKIALARGVSEDAVRSKLMANKKSR